MSAIDMVRGVQVQRVESPDEVRRWNELIRCHHYLGLTNMVGETLRYVAELGGTWVALLGFASAALKVTARDRFVGWTPEQRRTRLIYVAQNARFLILPGYHVRNLGSRVLGLTLRRLSDDWQEVHGHPVLVCETFVDPSRFDGGVYRAAGFVHVGETTGFAKNGNNWVEHNQPKLIWLRPLRRRALDLLRKQFLTPELLRGAPVVDPDTLPLRGSKGLVSYMQQISDPRARRGVRHPIATTLAVSVLAVICGMRSYRAIGQWAADLTQEQLYRLRAFRSPTSGAYVPPTTGTVRRALMMVSPEALDRAVCAYLEAVLEPRTKRRTAIDGKTLRGSASVTEGQRHLVSAVRHGLGIVVAQVGVDGKENEIPAAQRLLERIELEDTVVTADAMHTREKTADMIVRRGGEYLFTVKDNQPSLHQTLAALDWAFPPSVTTLDKGHGRVERRSIQVLHAPGAAGFPHAEQVARLERKVERTESTIENRRRVRTVRKTHEVTYLITSAYPEDVGPEELLALIRGHWTVEVMHHIRDVSLGEDHSQARTGSGPQAMAVLRSTAASLLRAWGFRTVPDGQRHYKRHVDDLLDRLGVHAHNPSDQPARAA